MPDTELAQKPRRTGEVLDEESESHSSDGPDLHDAPRAAGPDAVGQIDAGRFAEGDGR